MNSSLEQYLNNRRSEGANYTHVSLFMPKGKFKIDDYEELWRYVIENREKTGLAEIYRGTYIPILVDVDLKLQIGEEESIDAKTLYTLNQIKKLVKIYQEVIREITKNVKEENLCCLLLEKKGYTLKKNGKRYLKNGYHLHFPKMFLSRQHHELFLLPRIRLECKKLNSDEIPLGCTADQMVDGSYCRSNGQPWLMYGSSKESTMDSYRVTKAFDESGQSYDDWWNVVGKYEWKPETVVWKQKEELERHLPQILSVQPFDRQHYISVLKEGIELVRIQDKTSPYTNTSAIEKTVPLTMDENEYGLISGLIDILSNERAADRNDWIRVGWTLYNVTEGNEDGLQLWIKFSKKCPEKFEEGVCIYEWSRMSHRDVSLGTLKYMAKEDNEEMYEQTIKRYIRPLLEKSIKTEGNHYDLAKILFERYENEFKCASINHKIWFQFRDHIWKKVEDGFSLRSKLSNEIVEEYSLLMKRYVSEETMKDDTDGHKRVTMAIKMIHKLKTTPFKTHVMKEAMELFYDETFERKLDSDSYKIAFHNGIYDLRDHVFMMGKPEHNISLKMNIQYRTDLNEDSPEVKDIQMFLQKIFPDEAVREYFLNTICDIFVGGNLNKMVQIWTGDGDNGKSITQSLFEQMLGPYSIKLPTSLITGKRTQSSAACPELVRAGNGVRLAMLQEPDQRDVINIGILKELSGNDTFFARGLYREGQEITPMFKLILICNDPPKIHQNDPATWNRIRVIPFEATFCDNAPSSLQEQFLTKRFPKDKQFKDKIPYMVEALAWYLIERYKVKPKVVVEPEKVLLATSEYRSKNDIAENFIKELTMEKEGGFVTLHELYSVFKDWYKDSFPHQVLPCKFDVKSMIQKKWGVCVGAVETMEDGWKDKKLRQRKSEFF